MILTFHSPKHLKKFSGFSVSSCITEPPGSRGRFLMNTVKGSAIPNSGRGTRQHVTFRAQLLMGKLVLVRVSYGWDLLMGVEGTW